MYYIRISHYYTLAFESNSEKQRFAFTTRRGSMNLFKGGRHLSLIRSHAVLLKLEFPAATLKNFI